MIRRFNASEKGFGMMKSTTRLATLLLCVLLLATLVSCRATEGEEVPAGMQIASCAGADYRLYVPTSWVLNTLPNTREHSSISSASSRRRSSTPVSSSVE